MTPGLRLGGPDRYARPLSARTSRADGPWCRPVLRPFAPKTVIRSPQVQGGGVGLGLNPVGGSAHARLDPHGPRADRLVDCDAEDDLMPLSC